MDAESGAIIVAGNHKGQSGVLKIEEPIKAENEGVPMQQFFIHAPIIEWYAQIGQGADDAARQAMEHVVKNLYHFGLCIEEELLQYGGCLVMAG